MSDDIRKMAEDYCRAGIVVSVDGIEALLRASHATLTAERDEALPLATLVREWLGPDATPRELLELLEGREDAAVVALRDLAALRAQLATAVGLLRRFAAMYDHDGELHEDPTGVDWYTLTDDVDAFLATHDRQGTP